MSYVKFVPAALARAGSDNLRRIAACSNRRLRSTVASTQPDQADEQPVEPPCTVVKKPELGDFINQTTASPTTQTGPVSMDFENTQEAYKSKDTLELLRSLLVFKLCTYDFLVDKNKELMDLSKRVLGQRLFERVMKMTFYGQFVAGEDQESIKPLIQKNRAFGVGSVLDYSVEEDLTQEEAEKKEMDSCVSEAEKESPELVREYPASPEHESTVLLMAWGAVILYEV